MGPIQSRIGGSGGHIAEARRFPADKAKERMMELLAGQADADALIETSLAAFRDDAELGADERHWPLVARIAFITGTAAALWALVQLAASRAN